MATDRPTLGILAGGGRLPGQVAAAAKAAGRGVFLIGLEGFADPRGAGALGHMSLCAFSPRAGSWLRCVSMIVAISFWWDRCGGPRCLVCGRMWRARVSWLGSGVQPSPAMMGCWPPLCACLPRRDLAVVGMQDILQQEAVGAGKVAVARRSRRGGTGGRPARHRCGARAWRGRCGAGLCGAARHRPRGGGG